MDPKLRFSSRVENYIKYRPGYPAQLIANLGAGLRPQSRRARRGYRLGHRPVCAPLSGDRLPGDWHRAQSGDAPGGRPAPGEFCQFHQPAGFGRGDRIGACLRRPGDRRPGLSLVRPPPARLEFQRILIPAGWVVLAWNERRLDTTPFLRRLRSAFTALRHGLCQGRSPQCGERCLGHPGFLRRPFQQARFDNLQRFDFEGVKGRLLSSSYAPDAGHPDSRAMLADLRRIFDQHQSRGRLDFEYDTRMFWGHLAQD